MEDHAPVAVAAGAGAAVAAPAAVAAEAILVVAAEDHHATRLVTAALVPVPKPFYHQCFALLMYYPPDFTSWVSPDVSYWFLIFAFHVPDVLVDDLGM